MTTCAICGLPFEGKTSYGLCPLCLSKDKLREYDRLESASKQARREGVRASLTLVEWLSILSDTQAKCLYCLDNPGYIIERVDPDKGLDKDNAVPSCYVCHQHKVHGFDRAVGRVAAYLAGKVTFREQAEDTNFRVPVELWGKA